MRFIQVYARVLGLLRAEARLAVALAVANLAIAGFQFLEPMLFGRVIDLLSRSAGLPGSILWAQATQLLGAWAGVGCHRSVRAFWSHSVPTAWHIDAGLTSWAGFTPMSCRCRWLSMAQATPAM